MSDLERLDEIPDPYADAGEPPPMSAALVAALAAPSPTRARVRALRLGALALAVASQVVLVAGLGLRRDLASTARVAWALGAIGPLVAAAVALAVALRRGRAGLGVARGALVVTLAVAIAAFAIAVVADAALAGAREEPGLRANVVCAAIAVALAAGPMLLVALAFRRAFPAAAGARTASLGVACGALAALASHAHCAIDAPVHAIFGHGFAIALGALIGAGLARVTRS